MRRCLVPGGVVAVLESDEYHHVLLPWPVGLEVALTRAIRDGSVREHGAAGRVSPARTVNRMLREAGFEAVRKTTWPADRGAPFSPGVARFLRLYLAFLTDLAGPHLSARQRRRLAQLLDPDDGSSLFRREDAELTCLTALYLARRPDS